MIAGTACAKENNKGKDVAMKTSVKTLLALVMGLFLVTFTISCASTSSQTKGTVVEGQQVGFLGDYAKNLQPGPEGGAKMRWLKPGADFGKYNKIMLDSVIFFLADTSEYKGIDPQAMKELADACDKEVVDVLKGTYPIVAEPGPDVVRIRFAITHLEQSRPVLSAVTSIVPIGLGISLIKKGATGAWTGSGATGAEVMVLDSMTNDVIAVAQDERSAGFSERFSKWGSAEDAFKFWGERLKLFLDQAHGKTK
jgi:hypothetical protein